jgi:glutamine amidotransferase PdxT
MSLTLGVLSIQGDVLENLISVKSAKSSAIFILSSAILN